MTPSTTPKTLTEFDPLRERPPNSATPDPATALTPLSFKRRKPSNNFRGSLLDGILSRGKNDQEDKLPSVMFQGGGTSAAGENDDAEEDTFGRGAGTKKYNGIEGTTRLPSRGFSLSQRRGASLSGTPAVEVTPLPILPMIVLCKSIVESLYF